MPIRAEEAAAAQRPASQGPSALSLAETMETVLVDAIARAEKSVVAVFRVRVAAPGETLTPELRPDSFGRELVPQGDPEPTDPDFMPNEFATGVVIDRNGLILTAYHVLGENSVYYVATADRKIYRAWVKGADPRSDLAVLSIDATDLAPITFGDASALRKGQIVIALGNPYAIARDGQVSASWGIVANLGRKAPVLSGESAAGGKNSLHHFGTLIQTDAKLNLGTSGGPLLNLKGEMVGMNTSLPAAAGYEAAAGYAFPVDDTFRRAVEMLKQGREVEYGLLGIQPTNLSMEELAGGVHGTRVDRVVPGTPAFRYGVQPQDIIMAVNGRPIHDADGLVLEVGRLPVESVVRLDVLREQREMEVDVTLSKYPVRGRKIVTSSAPAWRGMRVDYPSAAVDEDGRGALGVPLTDEAVVVTEVQEKTPAWEAGLRRGMLISHVDRTPVHTPKEFQHAVAGKTGAVELRLVDAYGTNPKPIRLIAPGP